MFLRIASGITMLLVIATPGVGADRSLRVSVGIAPPIEYIDAAGQPQGFSVDVIREAARRQGLSIVWRTGGTAVSNNQSLRDGTLDLISAATATTERRASFYISEPWWWSELVAVTPAAGPVRGETDLHGRKLATPFADVLGVSEYYRKSTVISGPDPTWAADQMCSAAADAALFESVFLRDLLLSASPVCRGLNLRTFDVSVRRNYHLVARPAVAATAQALRLRIDGMTLDGTLATIAAKHIPISTPQATRMAELVRVKHIGQMWRFWLMVAGIAALAGVAFLVWQQRSRARLLALNTQLRLTQKELKARLAERVEAEEHIAWQAQLIAQTPAAVIASDSSHVVTFCNGAATRLLGWSETEAITGKPLDEIAVPATGAITWREVWESVEQTGLFHGELTWLNRSGDPLSIDAAIKPLNNAAGERVGHVGGFRNITNRRQAEEALRRSEHRLRLITETIPVGLLVFDRAGIITFSNSTAGSLLNMGSSEILGLHHTAPEWAFTDFEGVPMQPEARPFLRVRATEKSVFGVKLAVLSGGKRTCFSVNAAPLFGADGRIEGVVESMEDVTAHYELEKQYRHAQKMESLGQMAGGVAHDFNNLLTVIAGYSQLLLSGGLSPAQRLQAEQITLAGNRATELTRQLLAFSRKQPATPKPLNLNEVIQSDQIMLRNVTGARIELEMLLDPALNLIFADPTQIQQILMNLAINARDAMPSGGRLRIQTSNVPAIPAAPSQGRSGARVACVELMVEDTGTGMDKETLKHIFDPFFTTKDAGKGTGLGLSTVYGIVKQNGGWIRVASEPGKGARFSIHLPAINARQTVAAPADPAPASRENAVRGHETVLVVEDQPAVLGYMAECLRNSGYTVLEATSGKQALAVSRGHSDALHLLVTDMVMPGISGKDLADTLLSERPGLRVLLISGNAADGLGAVRQSGETKYQALQKPISPAALTKAVAEVLGSAHGRAPFLSHAGA